MNTTKWHSIKMYSLVIIAFVIGGIQAIHGHAGVIDRIGDVVLPILMFVEHTIGGNTDGK